MKIYLAGTNIFSPLGETTSEIFDRVVNGKSSVRLVTEKAVCTKPAYLSAFSKEQREKLEKDVPEQMSRFEKMCVRSIDMAIKEAGITIDDKTGFILSTTKGNVGIIDGSENSENSKLELFSSAEVLADRFNVSTKPFVISNACISGALGIITGARMIESGKFDTVIVSGGDVLSDFIVSGFQTLKAIGSTRCRPFDKNRDGINLGECASTVILTKKDKFAGADPVVYAAGAFFSDANHISGPSRTAEGLYRSIKSVLEGNRSNVSFISAHGTATVFNDEMEAIGFDRAEINEVPGFSLKGYLGHTLGAAGLTEVAFSIESLRKGIVPATLGYEEHGVSTEITVTRENLVLDEPKGFLKTASGFGGCNCALVIKKG